MREESDHDIPYIMERQVIRLSSVLLIGCGGQGGVEEVLLVLFFRSFILKSYLLES